MATTLKNLGAKWLSEKKVNFTPCISIIIIIIIIIIIVITITIAPNISFYLERSIVKVAVVCLVHIVDKFVKPSQRNSVNLIVTPLSFAVHLEGVYRKSMFFLGHRRPLRAHDPFLLCS